MTQQTAGTLGTMGTFDNNFGLADDNTRVHVSTTSAALYTLRT